MVVRTGAWVDRWLEEEVICGDHLVGKSAQILFKCLHAWRSCTHPVTMSDSAPFKAPYSALPPNS
eukprot:251974-Chlamydomonas_euryale.AAC.3